MSASQSLRQRFVPLPLPLIKRPHLLVKLLLHNQDLSTPSVHSLFAVLQHPVPDGKTIKHFQNHQR